MMIYLLTAVGSHPVAVVQYTLTAVGSHPVAVVQYTFTHKQYTERQKNKQYK
jgi:pyruvate kinase